MNIAERVQKRRESLGASTGEMASIAGFEPTRWESIENGSPMKVAELAVVARALAVEPGTFLRGEERSPHRSVARFREAVPTRPGLQELRTLAMAAELGRTGGALCERIGRPMDFQALRRPEPIHVGVEPWRDGYRLGELSRRSLGIPTGPILDLQSTLEKAGVHLATLPLSEDAFEAASLAERNAVPVLLLNESSPRTRSSLARRASMAHELCHLLYDSGEHDLVTRTKGPTSAEDDPVEQRARAFGPAFLAPRDEVRAWFRSGDGKTLRDPRRRVKALARRWGLSWNAAVWHAKNCDLIRPATADRLAKDAPPRQEWRDSFETDERCLPDLPAPPHPLCHGEIARMVAVALESGAVSEGRAREILSWGP